MNYPENTTRWKPGDLVIHDADAKESRMLMRVTGYSKTNGLCITRYLDPERRKIYENDIKYLLDPAPFGLTNAAAKDTAVEQRPSRRFAVWGSDDVGSAWLKDAFDHLEDAIDCAETLQDGVALDEPITYAVKDRQRNDEYRHSTQRRLAPADLTPAAASPKRTAPRDVVLIEADHEVYNADQHLGDLYNLTQIEPSRQLDYDEQQYVFNAALQALDTQLSLSRVLDDIWGLAYPGKTDWEYAGQVFNHIREKLSEGEKALRLLTTAAKYVDAEFAEVIAERDALRAQAGLPPVKTRYDPTVKAQ